MNYNMRVEIERVNGNFIVQVELSNAGRAKRNRLTATSLDDALAAVRDSYDVGMKEMEAFLNPPVAQVEPAPTVAAKDVQPATESKGAPKKAAAPTTKRKFAAA